MKRNFCRLFLGFAVWAGWAYTAEPAGLAVLSKAYPDVVFSSVYDINLKDWRITVRVENRTADLYWAGGRMLPAEKLTEKNMYWSLLYDYADHIPDPADFTQKDIERIRSFSSTENRTRGAASPPFFYDVLYDCKTQRSVEQHITKIRFLGKSSNLHKRMKEPLAAVEQDILKLAETDAQVQSFVRDMASADGYNWREISDSGSRSFHSIGIALDVLPKGWQQKNMYWAWRRDIDPENWMLLPLSRRWMPPLQVIDIFEKHGFIWGGKWIIWDNMHFEYHPEVILHNLRKNTL